MRANVNVNIIYNIFQCVLGACFSCYHCWGSSDIHNVSYSSPMLPFSDGCVNPKETNEHIPTLPCLLSEDTLCFSLTTKFDNGK